MIEQRLVRLAEPAFFDLHHHDCVGRHRESLDYPPDHPRRNALEDRQAVRARCPVVSSEAKFQLGGHALREVTGTYTHGLDCHIVRGLDRRPGACRPRHVEGGQRRLGSKRRQRCRRESNGVTIGCQGCDHDHSGSVPAECMLESREALGLRC